MEVYIANFGQQNYEWPECLRRSTIATMNEVISHGHWLRGDREAYIQTRLLDKTAAGKTPTRPVASRWFNLMTIISESVGDIWVHREKDELWWTTSKTETPEFYQRVEPVGRKRAVIVCHKPCEPWTNRDSRGRPLYWAALHARAKEFLATESTLQKLSPDNAAYALALIRGDDVSTWHELSEWRVKQATTSKKAGPVTTFSDKAKAAWRMANTAFQTTRSANGQTVQRTVKNKDMLFPDQEALRKYLEDLIEIQEGLCAVTGLTLQFDGGHEDAELLCSLDRIDSERHYEEGNLQVVCRFANRWKSDDANDNFLRLIELVRGSV